MSERGTSQHRYRGRASRRPGLGVVRVRERDRTRELRLSGELQAHTCGHLIALERDGAEPVRRLVVDLTDLEFIDSAGMRTLDWLRDAAREAGVECELVVASHGQVHRFLAAAHRI